MAAPASPHVGSGPVALRRPRGGGFLASARELSPRFSGDRGLCRDRSGLGLPFGASATRRPAPPPVSSLLGAVPWEPNGLGFRV